MNTKEIAEKTYTHYFGTEVPTTEYFSPDDERFNGLWADLSGIEAKPLQQVIESSVGKSY